MSWELIRSIQRTTDARLILPFGLTLGLGDVVSIGSDGGFTLEGTAASLLGLEPGKPRPAGEPVDLATTSGDEVTCTFRAAGKASSVSPHVPTAKAGFDLSFGRADSWVLALTGRRIQTFEVNPLRGAILDSYNRKVWKRDWALITGIGTVDRMTLIASTSRNTKVALSIGATVAADAPLEAKLTADVSIVSSSQQITQCVTTKPSIAFCLGLRVQDGVFTRAAIGALGARRILPRTEWLTAADADFWEDADPRATGHVG